MKPIESTLTKSDFSLFVAGLKEVIIYSSPDDKKKNRGFCFLEYESHKGLSINDATQISNTPIHATYLHYGHILGHPLHPLVRDVIDGWSLPCSAPRWPSGGWRRAASRSGTVISSSTGPTPRRSQTPTPCRR